MKRIVFALILVLLTATAAQAQDPVPDVKNPSAVEFTPSPDHALVDSYELDILRPDGTVLQTINIGKPSPDATNTCRAPINVQPVAFGVGYRTRLRARAGTAFSDYTLSLNAFERAPGGPSRLIAR